MINSKRIIFLIIGFLCLTLLNGCAFLLNGISDKIEIGNNPTVNVYEINKNNYLPVYVRKDSSQYIVLTRWNDRNLYISSDKDTSYYSIDQKMNVPLFVLSLALFYGFPVDLVTVAYYNLTFTKIFDRAKLETLKSKEVIPGESPKLTDLKHNSGLIFDRNIFGVNYIFRFFLYKYTQAVIFLFANSYSVSIYPRDDLYLDFGFSFMSYLKIPVNYKYIEDGGSINSISLTGTYFPFYNKIDFLDNFYLNAGFNYNTYFAGGETYYVNEIPNKTDYAESKLFGLNLGVGFKWRIISIGYEAILGFSKANLGKYGSFYPFTSSVNLGFTFRI